MSVTIILSQFGPEADAYEPALSGYRKYFPEAKFVLYTDRECATPQLFNKVNVVIPPFDRNHPRYGNRSNDWFKIKGLLDAETNVAIAVDGDTLPVSDRVQTLPALAERFGLCVPSNPRCMVHVDATVGEEGIKPFDRDYGGLHAVNMTPIAFDTSNERMRRLLDIFLMAQRANRVRGPLAMMRAAWAVGVAPAILAPQWCVCWRHNGIGNEIILHTGHEKVRDYYNVATGTD